MLVKSVSLLGAVAMASLNSLSAKASPLNPERIELLSARGRETVWTYSFGSEYFKAHGWPEVLKPTEDDKCVIVVQVAGTDVKPYGNNYFPHCSAGNWPQTGKLADASDSRTLTWVESPKWELGTRFYVLGGLLGSRFYGQNGWETSTEKVNPTRLKVYDYDPKTGNMVLDIEDTKANQRDLETLKIMDYWSPNTQPVDPNQPIFAYF